MDKETLKFVLTQSTTLARKRDEEEPVLSYAPTSEWSGVARRSNEIRERVMKTSLAWIVLLVLLPLTVLGQQRPEDRRRFFDENEVTTDDLRRLPIPPGLRGPDGSIVLRGGRLFDGTGTAPRPATLVIERNRILAILEPGVEGWPDENLRDLANVNLVIRDGYIVVEHGRVFIPRHEVIPEPTPQDRTP